MIRCAHDNDWSSCAICTPACTCTTCRVERPKAATRERIEQESADLARIFAEMKWSDPCDLPPNPARAPGVHPKSPCPCGAIRPDP